MAEIEIRVTVEDIHKGIRDSCTDCPIALALQRAFPEHCVCVDSDSFYFEDSIERPITLPDEARRFIEDFDGFVPVESFAFKVETPENY